MPELPLPGGVIDYELLPGSDETSPLVFLHEGLGSIDLWRSFPRDVTERSGRRGIVYSRHGHGRSAVLTEPRRPDYMHDEARLVLPEVLTRLGVERPTLVGHSDGASIALIYAGSGLGPVAGLVLLAPHVFVEDRSIEGVDVARRAYLTSDLADRMARHHHDADSTFWGWNRIWLAPEFRDWNIEEYLGTIECPILMIQGEDDEYGTMAQLDAIEAGVASADVERVHLSNCGHAPQIDRPDETVEAVVRHLARNTDGSGNINARSRRSR